MSDLLQEMATVGKARAADVPVFTASDFDKPVLPVRFGVFDVIAEIKDRSPAEGALATSGSSRSEQATRYAAGGAAAISVLTEPSRFDGEIAHLEEVVAAVPGVPVMRKDFLVDPAQVLEARKAGASGVLLIVTMLSDKVLRSMLDCAWEHGMFVLLESFDKSDLKRTRRLQENPRDEGALDTGQLLVGVNTRNLRTLEVDTQRLRKLARKLPGGRCVAESGIKTPEDAAQAAAWGYQLALVGTALMKSEYPGRLIREMCKAAVAP